MLFLLVDILVVFSVQPELFWSRTLFCCIGFNVEKLCYYQKISEFSFALVCDGHLLVSQTLLHSTILNSTTDYMTSLLTIMTIIIIYYYLCLFYHNVLAYGSNKGYHLTLTTSPNSLRLALEAFPPLKCSDDPNSIATRLVLALTTSHTPMPFYLAGKCPKSRVCFTFAT